MLISKNCISKGNPWVKEGGGEYGVGVSNKLIKVKDVSIQG
jgi:hypothetical protein